MLDILDFKKLNDLESIALTKHAKDRLLKEISLLMILLQQQIMVKLLNNMRTIALSSCLILGCDCHYNPIHIVASHDDHFI